MKCRVARVLAKIVPDMETVMLQHGRAHALKDGPELDANYLTARAHRTVLVEAYAMAHSKFQNVRIALVVGWDRTVISHACTEFRLQWIVGTVFVRKGGLVLDVTVSVPVMVLLSPEFVIVMSDGGDIHVKILGALVTVQTVPDTVTAMV